MSVICHEASINQYLLLSTGLLAEYLTNLKLNAFLGENATGFKDSIGLPKGDVVAGSWSSGSFPARTRTHAEERHLITRRMRQDGWCPNDIVIASRLGASGWYFASLMPHPRREKQHRRCSSKQCTVGQHGDVRVSTLRHIKPSCNCNMIRVSRLNLTAVLEANTIPLIKTSSPEHSPVVFELVPYGTQDYAAISHAWSDGIGKPKENALTSCQHLEISKLVYDLYGDQGEHFYWLDTMTCPVEPMSSKQLALEKMRETYMQADKVLVLGSWLMSQSLSDMSDFEVVIKYRCQLGSGDCGRCKRGFWLADYISSFTMIASSSTQSGPEDRRSRSGSGKYGRYLADFGLLPTPLDWKNQADTIRKQFDHDIRIITLMNNRYTASSTGNKEPVEPVAADITFEGTQRVFDGRGFKARTWCID